jgi:hypothetical protein
MQSPRRCATAFALLAAIGWVGCTNGTEKTTGSQNQAPSPAAGISSSSALPTDPARGEAVYSGEPIEIDSRKFPVNYRGVDVAELGSALSPVLFPVKDEFEKTDDFRRRVGALKHIRQSAAANQLPQLQWKASLPSEKMRPTRPLAGG